MSDQTVHLEAMPPNRVTLVEDWRQDERQGVLSISKRQNLLQVHVPHDAHSVEISHCPKLDGIYVHAGVQYLSLEEVGLGELILPSGVRDVRLKNCKNLKKLVVPDSVWNVTIEDCSALEALKLPADLACLTIIGYLKLTDIDIPTQKLTTLRIEISNLASVTVPHTVQVLHLERLSQLRQITIPEGVKTVHLSYCGVEELTIPASVTRLVVKELPDHRGRKSGLRKVVFQGNAIIEIRLFHCCFLTDIAPPASAIDLTLEGARQLKTLTVPSGTVNLNLSGCEQLSELRVPNTVEKLNLSHCTNLSTVLGLPTGLQEADLGYSGLTGITIPSGTTLAKLDIRYCGNITELTIPDGIRITGELNVTHCSKLTKLTVQGNQLGSLNIFECHGLTDLTVPAGTRIDWWLQHSNLTQYTCGGKIIPVAKK